MNIKIRSGRYRFQEYMCIEGDNSLNKSRGGSLFSSPNKYYINGATSIPWNLMHRILKILEYVQVISERARKYILY